MTFFSSWPTSNQGNIVGSRLSTAISRYFRGLMSGLSFADQRDAALTELINNPGIINVQAFGATGDGTTDDTTDIQAALDAAAVSGGIVVFPPAATSYLISSTLTVSTDVHVQLDGAVIEGVASFSGPYFTLSGTRLSLRGGRLIQGDTAYIGVRISASNCALEDTTIEDASVPVELFVPTSSTLSNIRVVGVTATEFTSHGINFNLNGEAQTSLTNVLIAHTTLTTTAATYANNEKAMQVHGEQLRITDNYISGGNTVPAASTGIHDGIFLNNDTDLVTVSGNTVIEIGDDCITIRGLNTTVSGNVVAESGLFGISSINQVTPTEHVVIVGNVCKNNLSDNIIVISSRRYSVENNVCSQAKGTPTSCIRIQSAGGANFDPVEILISGNICDGGGITNNSLFVVGGGVFYRLINNHCIDATTYGLHLIAGDQTVISGGFYADTRSGGSRTQQRGIFVDPFSNKVQIIGAFVYNNVTDGIRLERTAPDQADSVDIIDCWCEANTVRGIDLESAHAQVRIIGNRCLDNGSDGIRASDTVRLEIMNNRCDGNGVNGILIRDGTFINVSGNQCYDNTSFGINLFRVTGSLPNDVILANNICDNNTGGEVNIESLVGTVHYGQNIGYVTRNSGTATVLNGQTAIVVTHGLSRTPLISDIMITPQEDIGSASKFWVDTITSTQFTINVNTDPGANTDFSWQAMISKS